MEGERTILTKLRQIAEHARALTAELPSGDAQNRARLIWGLASHLVLTQELHHQRAGSEAFRERPSDRPND